MAIQKAFTQICQEILDRYDNILQTNSLSTQTKTEILAAKKAVESLKASVDRAYSDVSANTNYVKATKGQIDGFKTELENRASEVVRINSSVNSAKNAIEVIKNQIDAIKSGFDSSYADFNTKKERFDTKSTEVNQNLANLNAKVNQNLADLNAKKDDFTNMANEANMQIINLEQMVENATNSLRELLNSVNSSVDTANTKKDNLDASIQTANNTKQELEVIAGQTENLVNNAADQLRNKISTIVDEKMGSVTRGLKNEIDNKINTKSSELNSRIDGVNNSLTNSINAKANSNAVVALSGNQTINGVKTFTSNIIAPNITTLQNQMNGLSGLVSGGKSPYLLEDEGFISILVGVGLNPRDYEGGGHYHKVFTNLTDTFRYLKKNGLSNLDTYIMITTNSEFNDDLSLSELPPCQITAGYKFANNLHIRNCSGIIFEHLVLGGNLTVENSNITIRIADIRSRVIDEYYSGEAFEKSSIIAINSTIIIAGYAQFYPSNDACSIVAKEGSQVIITNSNVYQNTSSRYFAYVESGGKIASGGRGRISGSFEAKTNIAPNTWSPNGMILGNNWR